MDTTSNLTAGCWLVIANFDADGAGGDTIANGVLKYCNTSGGVLDMWADRFTLINGGGNTIVYCANPGSNWRLILEVYTGPSIKMRVRWQAIKLTK